VQQPLLLVEGLVQRENVLQLQGWVYGRSDLAEPRSEIRRSTAPQPQSEARGMDASRRRGMVQPNSLGFAGVPLSL
jgi:hypothetical protein